jgi:hypothetical protein
MASDSDPGDELYLVPPPSFVAARNQLAAALKKAGKKAEAEAIKALAKPPVSVWAINHVARHDSAAMAEFLDASDQLRRAQIAGAATPEARQEYQASAARQREALQPLLERVEQALTSAGLNAGKAMLDKVANDLRWGAVDDQVRPRLAAGRLQDDVAPTDFSALVGHIPILDRASRPEPPPPPPSPSARVVGQIGPAAGRSYDVAHDVVDAPKPVRTAKPDRSHQAEQAERDRARKEAEGVRAELKAARSLAQRARQTLVARRTANDRAQDHLDQQKRALAEAVRAADEAQQALVEAERIAGEQERQVDRLSEDLARLETRFA